MSKTCGLDKMNLIDDDDEFYHALSETNKPKSKKRVRQASAPKSPNTQIGIFDKKNNSLLMSSVSKSKKDLMKKIENSQLVSCDGKSIEDFDLLCGFVNGDYKVVEFTFTVNIIKEF